MFAVVFIDGRTGKEAYRSGSYQIYSISMAAALVFQGLHRKDNGSQIIASMFIFDNDLCVSSPTCQPERLLRESIAQGYNHYRHEVKSQAGRQGFLEAGA